ncbi:MAG TPA: sugar ABC transporter permease, partial [Clostridia bacterium]|nr:sugar ABC transporter permease [Clostridia bacterium]
TSVTLQGVEPNGIRRVYFEGNDVSELCQGAKKKPKMSARSRADSWFGFALTVPAIIVLCIVIALPILKGILVSFFDYHLKDLTKDAFNLDTKTVSDVFEGKTPFVSSEEILAATEDRGASAVVNYTWNGFKNYRDLFVVAEGRSIFESEFFTSFLNTLIFVFLMVVIQTILGMMIALLLNSQIKGRGLFRGLLLVPWTIPSVVVAIVWRLMLHQEGGIVNYVLYVLGFTSTTRVAWASTVTLARAAIIIAAEWRQLPYMMVMLLAGLQSVDRSMQEAALIDGADAWQSFLHVTLPSIKPVLISAVWIAIMSNFQMYTIIANLIGTGSTTGTNTLSIAAYQEAFVNNNFGKGAAIGVLWLIVLLVITIVSNRLSSRSATDYQ